MTRKRPNRKREKKAEGRKLIEAVRQLDLEKGVHRVVTTGEGQELELELHRSRKNILVNLYR